VVAALAFVAAPGNANHGQAAIWYASDGSQAYVGSYSSGNFDDQIWNFVAADGSNCEGFGSIEVGFTGTCVDVGGTGHQHIYANPSTAVHTDPATVDGQPGAVVSVL
jgi:sugar/nucleoside kinase (ribokinase family)